MNAWVMDRQDVKYLDEILLDEKGLPRPVPFLTLAKFPISHLVQWGNEKGVYTIPTVELIEWLKDAIGGRKAIEICAGHGAIARSLGIVATDSYIQTKPEMMAFYRSIGQNPIQPPTDVYEFEANEAVDTLHPQVVVASFATQKYQVGDEGPPKIGSSVYGVDEISMLQKIQTYINIGNDQSHGDKRILKYPHETYRFPWLVTRCMHQEQNHIKVWHVRPTI